MSPGFNPAKQRPHSAIYGHPSPLCADYGSVPPQTSPGQLQGLEEFELLNLVLLERN